jgi:Icc-related predicted phosphoesterase
MKFEFGSDLHLDFNVSQVSALEPKADYLVLAGDILEITMLFDRKNSKASFVRDWLKQISDQYKQVIWVMGNHEHYGHYIDRSFDDARKYLDQNGIGNIKILENETLTIEDTIFFGATLWTDFQKSNPLVMKQCEYGMNDYQMIRIQDVFENRYANSMGWRDLRAEDTLGFHLNTRKKLRDFVDLETDKKKVLVTHHLPFLQCLDLGDAMNGAYASDLFYFLADTDIRLAIHGHSHRKHTTEVGEIIVKANPRGYYGYETDAYNFSYELVDV